MLIPPAAISILVILYGLVTTRLNEIGDVCTSDMLLCPRCHYSRCKREALKSSCLFAHLNYLFDNAVVVAFAIVMSLWSTVFMEMWQREDSVLRLQWNVTPYEYLIVPRPQYTEQTDELKFCPISGTLEPHMSKRSVTYRYALTSVCILLLLAVMVLATFAVMVYRVSVNLAMVRSVDVDVITGNTGLIASATGALMSAVFIVIFKWFYEKVALKLTELENHRTQDAFVNAYIYKSYALAFTNNYAPLFYIAFFKVLTERTKPRSALSTVSGQVFHSPRRLEDVEFDRRFGFGYLRPDGLRGRFGDAHVHDNGGKSDSEQRAASRGADLGEPVQRVSLENMDERRRAAVGEGIPARAHRRIFHYRRIHGHGLTSVGVGDRVHQQYNGKNRAQDVPTTRPNVSQLHPISVRLRRVRRVVGQTGKPRRSSRQPVLLSGQTEPPRAPHGVRESEGILERVGDQDGGRFGVRARYRYDKGVPRLRDTGRPFRCQTASSAPGERKEKTEDERAARGVLEETQTQVGRLNN
ncbi:anoctamin-8-like isoform X3 [Cylas formicarius]|uniref:anoctamin-8-like isoform X3 n=1 Tax=Cylas formicarius TaxID=197179 RepID=UPI0029587978|nr:anoctamin-8-like isoform X3 [Cylas formicarius]XP_060527051.1 anoctamin-8-like isoform X3 [Cylas formicarius]